MAGKTQFLLWLACAAGMGSQSLHAAAPDYTVYAAGDIAYCEHPDPAWSGAAATGKIVEAGLSANRDAAVLLLGDITYPRGTLREFTEC